MPDVCDVDADVVEIVGHDGFACAAPYRNYMDEVSSRRCVVPE